MCTVHVSYSSLLFSSLIHVGNVVAVVGETKTPDSNAFFKIGKNVISEGRRAATPQSVSRAGMSPRKLIDRDCWT